MAAETPIHPFDSIIHISLDGSMGAMKTLKRDLWNICEDGESWGESEKGRKGGRDGNGKRGEKRIEKTHSKSMQNLPSVKYMAIILYARPAVSMQPREKKNSFFVVSSWEKELVVVILGINGAHNNIIKLRYIWHLHLRFLDSWIPAML